jgi:hypothetical protein
MIAYGPHTRAMAASVPAISPRGTLKPNLGRAVVFWRVGEVRLRGMLTPVGGGRLACRPGAAQRLQEPLAARIAHLVQAGELPAHLNAEYEGARLRVLLDGLRLQLITTPRQTSASRALAVLDDHLTALTAARS